MSYRSSSIISYLDSRYVRFGASNTRAALLASLQPIN